MAARGMFFGEGPTACPFVALESDRDRRSDEPDHRHRCYAEPDPAPRALAHQREYCLAAAFTACPIFQDWAIRAAATPVPLRPGRMGDSQRDEHPAWAAPPPWLAAEGDEESASGEPVAAEDGRADAMAGFVGPPDRSPHEVERVPSLPSADGTSSGSGQEGEPVRPEQESDARPQPAPSPERTPPPEEVPLPAFLAGRTEQPTAEPRPAGRSQHESLRREDVVPAWGRQPLDVRTRSRISHGDSGGLLSKITTMLAVAAILALALVAIILAPSLFGLFDGGAPGPTLPGGGAPSPTLASPTASPAPTPGPTPRTYTVQAGDTLFSIARRHGLTVEQLLAANPHITNPDLVQIGQVLVIPDDDFGLFTPAPASPIASP